MAQFDRNHWHPLTETGGTNQTEIAINSFIGLKPTTYSSGEHDWKGHLTIRKHNALRSALIECSWQTIQKDPVMLVKYEELCKRITGKRAVM